MSPSKHAMINGETWAMGAPVCSCRISQVTLGPEKREKERETEERNERSLIREILFLLVPFLINSRSPLSFSSTLVCVRSVFQIAMSSGWCLSLKARSVVLAARLLDAAAAAAAAGLDDEFFSSRFSRWLSLSRCESLPLRDERESWCELKRVACSDRGSEFVQFLLGFAIWTTDEGEERRKNESKEILQRVVLPHRGSIEMRKVRVRWCRRLVFSVKWGGWR